MSRPTTRPLRWPELNAEIARQDRTIAELGATVGLAPRSLNQAMRGLYDLSAARKTAIAAELGRPVSELFAEPDRGPADRAAASAAAQGLDELITDAAVLRRLAALVAAQLTTPVAS